MPKDLFIMSNFCNIMRSVGFVGIGATIVWKFMSKKRCEISVDFTGNTGTLMSEVPEETIPDSEENSFWSEDRCVHFEKHYNPNQYDAINFNLTPDEYANLPEEQYEETIPDEE